MRVIALGFALPNPSIDNYTFASAPSLFDYDAVIVDPASLSRLIEEVIDQAGEHTTHTKEPVVNGAGGPVATGLADLLRRRQTEVARLLALGKPLVCFAYPNVYHHRLAGFTGCDRYFWLPAPSGVQYREPHLLAGEGGSILTFDGEHPFAAYIDAFKKKLGYRAYFSDAIPGFEGFGRVFARSAGGAAVGVELRVDAGRIVFIPPLAEPGTGSERHPFASTLVDCIRRLLDVAVEGPAPSWVRRYTLPGLDEAEAARDAAVAQVAQAQEGLAAAESQLRELDKYRRLLWQEGKHGLEAAVRDALHLLEFQVSLDQDDPLTLYAGGVKVFVEVEGSPEAVGMEPHYRLRRRLEEGIAETGNPQHGLIVINGHRSKEPEQRPAEYQDALRVAAESMRYAVLTSTQLFSAVKRFLEGDKQAAEQLRERLLTCEGIMGDEAPAAPSAADTGAKG